MNANKTFERHLLRVDVVCDPSTGAPPENATNSVMVKTLSKTDMIARFIFSSSRFFVDQPWTWKIETRHERNRKYSCLPWAHFHLFRWSILSPPKGKRTSHTFSELFRDGWLELWSQLFSHLDQKFPPLLVVFAKVDFAVWHVALL